MTLLRIIGTDLPGRECGAELTNVHVGIQLGLEPTQVVPADVDRVVFQTEIDIVRIDDRYDFRGDAVRGRPHHRFVYLAWGNPDDDGFNMFRRAKLMLDDIEDEVIGGALLDGALEGTLELVDGGGLPRCAAVRPPGITWSSMTVPRRIPPGLHESH